MPSEKQCQSICTECIHEEKHWDKLKYYDSSCQLEHRVHPVTGVKYLATGGLCKDKNAKGDCPDFKERSPAKELTGCFAFIVVAAIIVGFLIW